MDPFLQLSQTLRLSPTLLQSMGILQMNTMELAEHLKDLALENPLLEEAQADPGRLAWEDFSSQVPWAGSDPLPTGGGQGEPGRRDREPESLSFLLEEQLGRKALPGPLDALCRYLVGLLDDHGRLDREDLDHLLAKGIPQTLLEQAVAQLQSLDPAGVAARDLGECLALQLSRLPGDHTLALALTGHLEELAQGRYAPLARQLGATPAQIQSAAQVLASLDPDPAGEPPEEAPVQYVRPDAWVAVVEGELRVFVNQWDLPQFDLSRDYLALAKGAQGEEAAYLSHKIHQARWVLQCVRRRQATLEGCLTALVQAQAPFFREQALTPGPLLRRELAQTLSVHPSTVTRTLAHKYIQCRQGLFPTGYFFSRTLGSPQAPASRQAVQGRIAALIRAEDPKHPLSDQAIAACLAQENLPIARRTVAKYRQGLGLPPGHLRKK